MILRIFKNGFVLSVECLAIVCTGWVAYRQPIVFMAVTGFLGLTLGLALEYPRLENELRFYLGRPLGSRSIPLVLYASGEAILKGLLGSLAALLTFCGTDKDRLWLTSLLLVATIFVGTNILRWLRQSFNLQTVRWGYFRLTTVLGIIFSAGLASLASLKLISTPSLAEIIQTTVFETAPKPALEQGSELLFKLKYYFDGAIVQYLSLWTGKNVAEVLGIILSVNMLTGFVAAIYTVVIEKMSETLEKALAG